MVEYRIPKAQYIEPPIGHGLIPLGFAQRMIDKGFKLLPIYEVNGHGLHAAQRLVGYSFASSFASWTEHSTGDHLFAQGEAVRHDCPMEDADGNDR